MLSGSIDSLDLGLDVIVREEFSPAARSLALATFAVQVLAVANQIDKNVLGFIPRHRTIVDGREGAAETQVKPDGEIDYEFELVNDLLVWVIEQLRTFAPVLSGQFQDSFVLFADGVQVDPDAAEIAPAREYVFLSPLAYSRKIEGADGRPPESKQAPNGVFEPVAVLAAQRFGNQAEISFDFMAPRAGELLTGKASTASAVRVPAIVIRLRG
jgi:hypothetical protein